TLIECRTYRTRAHAEGMGDFTYRTREEVESWKPRCPIKRLRDYLLENRLATEKELTAIEAEIAEEIERAHVAAEKAPWPTAASAATHVYAEPRRVSPLPQAKAEREVTFMQATLEALAHEMERNPGIFVLGEGIGKRGGNFRTTLGLY